MRGGGGGGYFAFKLIHFVTYYFNLFLVVITYWRLRPRGLVPLEGMGEDWV